MSLKDDPFALLGLPRRFDLDPEELRRAWLRRSARLHPDRCPDPIAQAETAEHAARLNDAHAVLADDERRANALLALLGGPTAEEERALPDGFLVEIMSVREDMEEAVRSVDDRERARFETWAAERRRERLDRVASLLDQASSRPDLDARRAARIELNALRYLERMIEQLDPDHRSLL